MSKTRDPGLHAYIAGGSESETALRRNRQALDDLALLPRVLVDVTEVDASARFLGLALKAPVLLAPVGSVHLLDERGVEGVRLAAEHAGIAYAVGSALPEAQAVTASARTPAFYQLYVEGGDDWLDEQCRGAMARGYRAVIVTVDVPVFPERPRDIAAGNHAANRQGQGTSVFRRGLDWDTLARLAARHPDVPIILKGLQDPRDAQLACEAGAAAVYLSNHGGRQFDQGPGTASLIRPFAQAIAGRVPLIVDGGFATGNDVLKALALGADLVGIGRAYLHPYAEGGLAGAAAYLDKLAGQLATNLALLGARTLRDLAGLRVLRGDGTAVLP